MKGHGFSRATSAAIRMRALAPERALPKNSDLFGRNRTFAQEPNFADFEANSTVLIGVYQTIVIMV